MKIVVMAHGENNDNIFLVLTCLGIAHNAEETDDDGAE